MTDDNMMQLPETPATLYAIKDLFKRMEPHAKELYYVLDKIVNEKTYYMYDYEDFYISYGTIKLVGAYYDRWAERTTNEYEVSFGNFFDPEYLTRKKAEAEQVKLDKQLRAKQEEINQKLRLEIKELEEYARLKAKFET